MKAALDLTQYAENMIYSHIKYADIVQVYIFGSTTLFLKRIKLSATIKPSILEKYGVA